MPNHCYQTVSLRGNIDVIHHLYDALQEGKRFCDVVSPMPLRTYLLPHIDETEKYGFETKTPAWYNWRLKFWGTKWDVCDVEVVDEIKMTDYQITSENIDKDVEVEAWFTFKCWTAWGPPIPIWKKLHDMGVQVRAYYEDEGMDFQGSFIDGVDKAWRPHIDEVIEEDEACKYK